MNIIVVFTFDISLENWKDTRILNREILLYKRLNQNYNLNFTFITFGDESDDKYQGLFDELQIIPIYKYIKKSRYVLINIFKSIFICFKLRKKLWKYDLIKTNQLTGGIVGIFLKFFLKIPLIVRTGYNNYDFAKYEKKSSKVVYLYYVLTQLSLLLCNSYIVSSNVDRESLINNFRTKDNIYIFSNWVEKVNYSSNNQKYNNKILSIGRLEEQKDYAGLIHKLSKSNIELNIVGDGSQKDTLLHLSRTQEVNLKILEKIDFKKIDKLYQKYPIFISSSIFEGNPKVILEAMANGCLVIAKNNINNQEIITNGYNGILYSEDDNLIKIINYYLENENLRSKLIKNGYNYILNNNILENYCKKEFELYSNLVKS